MAETVTGTRGLIGVEDFERTGSATRTFNRTTSTGGTQTMTKVDIGEFLGGVFNVKDYGAVGDFVSSGSPGTDDSAAIQACVTACADAGGGTVYFPAGWYRIDTGITLTKTGGAPAINMKIEGAGSASGFSASGASSLYSDQAIVALSWGTSGTTTNNGPYIKNISIKDYSNSGVGGAMLGGVSILRGNWWTLDNVAVAGVRVGYGYKFDGGADWVQYGTILQPKISNTKYGIVNHRNVTDITMIGGQLLGSNPSVTPTGPWGADGSGSMIDDSIGIWFDGTNEGATGRWSVLGTGVNNFETGVYLDGSRYCTLSGLTVECHSSAAGFGTGFRIAVGDHSSTDMGDSNRIIGGVIVRYGVGIQIDADASKNEILHVAFNGMSSYTLVTDNGKATSILGSNGGDANHLGWQYGYGDLSGNTQAVKLIPRAQQGLGNAVQPQVRVSNNRAINFHQADSDGGGYLGVESDTEVIFGAGLAGDPQAPKMATTDAAAVIFKDDEIHFALHTAATAGDAFGAGNRSLYRWTGRADNSQVMETSSVVALKTLTGASTSTASTFIPAGSLLLGVSAYMKTLATSGDGGTDFNLGISSDHNAFGNAIALAQGTSVDISDHTITSPLYITTDTAITAYCAASGVEGGETFNAGELRIVAHYIKLTAPTS